MFKVGKLKVLADNETIHFAEPTIKFWFWTVNTIKKRERLHTFLINESLKWTKKIIAMDKCIMPKPEIEFPLLNTTRIHGSVDKKTSWQTLIPIRCNTISSFNVVQAIRLVVKTWVIVPSNAGKITWKTWKFWRIKRSYIWE